MYKRAQMGIGYLAQEASVFRKLSVEDNIKGVLEMTSLSKEEQAERLEELLNEFGLQHIRKTRGDLLSGESAAGRKLLAPWLQSQNSFYSMSHLLVWIPLPSKIFRALLQV